MKTLTEVCNLALAKIGAASISSYETENTLEAMACRTHLPQARDSLLRRHQWNFATRRALLSRVATFQCREWPTAWALPTDLVRLIRIPSSDPANPLREFTIEGRLLLAHIQESPELLYISNSTPVSEWDTLFIEALTLQLASELSGPIAKNPGLASQFDQQLERMALPTAQTADAREVASGENFGPRHLSASSALIAARFRK